MNQFRKWTCIPPDSYLRVHYTDNPKISPVSSAFLSEFPFRSSEKRVHHFSLRHVRKIARFRFLYGRIFKCTVFFIWSWYLFQTPWWLFRLVGLQSRCLWRAKKWVEIYFFFYKWIHCHFWSRLRAVVQIKWKEFVMWTSLPPSPLSMAGAERVHLNHHNIKSSSSINSGELLQLIDCSNIVSLLREDEDAASRVPLS